MMYNKRGGEKLLSAWWIFVLAIVGITIVGMVWLNYSSDIDTRALESSVLVEKLSQCLNNNGFITEDILSPEFNISAKCGLSERVFSEGYLYFEVEIIDSYGKSVISSPISAGPRAMKADCLVTKNIQAERYPKCTSENVSLLHRDGLNSEMWTMNLFAASNQMGEKLSLA